MTVTQPDIYSTPWPTVSGDHAEYRIDGGRLPEFEKIEWWGCLSTFSVPRAPVVPLVKLTGRGSHKVGIVVVSLAQ